MSLEQKWAQAITGNIDAQVKLFLRAFVLDFQGKFEEVLDIAENYKNFAQGVDLSNIYQRNINWCAAI